MDDFELDAFESYAKIVVIGVGGAGSNAVNQMLEEKIANIEFWVFNTDAQALATSKAENRLVLGRQTTRGLGAGGDPQVGREAALDSVDDIKRVIEGANMVFIAAGMGGGTGTGAAPVVAKLAKDAGALTVAIVTRPFTFEGNSRKVKAVEGITELKSAVDSIIIVSNDKLMFMNGSRPISEAFNESDKVLAQSVKTITDLILLPGLINLDFADVRSTLKDKGVALIGFGMGSGEHKAEEASSSAIASPLLEASVKGAHSAIINITGGKSVTLDEAQEAVNYITEAAGNNVNIIFGVQQNPELNDQMLISVIATEFDEEYDYSQPTNMFVSRTKQTQTTNNDGEIQENSNGQNPEESKQVKNPDEDILPNFLQGLKDNK
ncbi:MAG TPA: cell division protein FtsZ [Firmicutes bacterium]|nr:cell division protein FtsZ [Bacillota bacterium]HAX00433.1 cell division protein FtsZ [Bacillota bacterium]